MTESPAASGIDDGAKERARSLKNLRNARYRERQKAMARPTAPQVDQAMMLAVLKLQRAGFLPAGTMRQVVMTATESLVEDGHREVSAAVHLRTVELGAASLRPAASPDGPSEPTPLSTPVTSSVRDAKSSVRIVDPTRLAGRRFDPAGARATF